MLVDVAHTSRRTALASIQAGRAPTVIAHSSRRGLVDHPRNVDEGTMRAFADAGGLLMPIYDGSSCPR
jgi:membrane dipeptidase